MIARGKVGLCLGASAWVVGCAYGIIPSSDEAVPLKLDAGKDSAIVHVVDASKGMDVAETPDTSPGIDVAPQCVTTMTTGIPACDSCLTQYCCSQDNACAASSDCTTLETCYGGCVDDAGIPDSACMSTCDSTYPTGAKLLGGWSSCLQTSCASSCR